MAAAREDLHPGRLCVPTGSQNRVRCREKLAATMCDMHADTLRVATSGNYWLVPGTQFATAGDLGDRDILAECVAACKPRGIRVVPYIRTGGGVAAVIVNPDWAYRDNPDGHIPV